MDHRHRGQCQRHVDPEHVLPATRQPDDEDSVQRAEHAAQLLRGADAPSIPARFRWAHRSAPSASVTGSSAPLATPWMVRPTTSTCRSVDSAVITEPAMKVPRLTCSSSLRPNRSEARPSSGNRGDVAQQVPGDDRRDPLEVIDRDADGGDDVAHDGDHDVGVEGTEQYGQAACADRDSAPGMRCRHPATGGLVTCTGAFQFDSVIWTELPGLCSSCTCTNW